jgi:hypothetical protein
MAYNLRDRINVCLDAEIRRELRTMAAVSSCSEGELIRRAVAYLLLHPEAFMPPVYRMRRGA